MIEIKGIDLTRLKVGTHRMARALKIKTADVVLVQTGILAKDMVYQSIPKDKNKARKAAALEVKRSLYPSGGTPITQPAQKVFSGRKARKSASGGKWLYAAPNLIVGVGEKDLQTRGNIDALILHRTEQKRAGGPRWLKFGKRKNQHVMIVDKPVVSRTAYKRVIRQVEDSFGKIKASFAAMLAPLRVRASVERWIARHIPGQISKGCRVVLNLENDKPSITLIARSKGIENQKELKIIRGQLRRRAFAMAKDLRLYIRGVKKLSDFGKGVIWN